MKKGRGTDHSEKVDPGHGGPRHLNGHEIFDVRIHQETCRPEKSESQEKRGNQDETAGRGNSAQGEDDQGQNNMPEEDDPFSGVKDLVRQGPHDRPSDEHTQIHEEDYITGIHGRKIHDLHKEGTGPEILEGRENAIADKGAERDNPVIPSSQEKRKLAEHPPC